MQRVTLWQVRSAAGGVLVELVGAYADVPAARRVLHTSIPRGAVVDEDGEVCGLAVKGQRGDLTRDERDEIERAAADWRALPQPPAGRSPEVEPDPHEAIGVGAATEVLPRAAEAGTTLPTGDGLAREALSLREDLARVTAERDDLRRALDVMTQAWRRSEASAKRVTRAFAAYVVTHPKRADRRIASPVLDLIEAVARRAR